LGCLATPSESWGARRAATAAIRAAVDGGCTVLALGNAGSAIDATDALADLRAPTRRGWPGAARSTLPPTPRSSRRWPTTSAPDMLFRGR
jgi:hypothetical protein